jgi:peptidoglycan/LPS O-acetylase OafA/YrhL
MRQAIAVGQGRAERLHALDAVRGGALLLGVVFHATLSFLTPRIWIVGDAHSVALTILFFVLHVFRLTVFFLLAGFFARMLLERRGVGGFVKNRAGRILAPLVAFWPIVLAAIIAVAIWSGIDANGGKPIENPPPQPPLTAQTFPLTHLWFLYALILLYAAALSLRGLVKLVDRSGKSGAGLDVVVRVLVKSPFAPLVLGAPAFAALALKPDWYMWFGVPTPDTGLVPNIAAIAAYGTAFGFGWLLHRQSDLMRAWEKSWPLHLAAASALIAACLWLAGPTPTLAPAAMDWRKLVFAGLYVLAIWSASFAIIGLALKYLSGHSGVRRYVSDASYWIYIVHLPLIMVGEMLVLHLALPVLAKYALVLGGTLLAAFATYHLMVRYSFIGAILNGRKPKLTAKQDAPVPAAAE